MVPPVRRASAAKRWVFPFLGYIGQWGSGMAWMFVTLRMESDFSLFGYSCKPSMGVGDEKERKTYTPEEKVAIIREHPLEGVAVSDLYDAQTLAVCCDCPPAAPALRPFAARHGIGSGLQQSASSRPGGIARRRPLSGASAEPLPPRPVTALRQNGLPGTHAVQSPRPWCPAGQHVQSHVWPILSLSGFAVHSLARHRFRV